MKNHKTLLTLGICLLGVLWAFITLGLLLPKLPWADESRAWSIAFNLPWYQLFDLVRYEGHFFLGFILLKGLAWLHIPFPWGMYALNWLICAGCIYLLLTKAPFSWPIKTAAMFSYPLLIVYPVYARPYGMAVLCLFLLAVFYRERLTKPRLYACLLFLCAHTVLCGTIGAVAFGCIYAWDMWKKAGKDILKYTAYRESLLLCVLTAVCLAVECLGYQRPAYRVLWPVGDFLSSLSWQGSLECMLFCMFAGCIFRCKRAVFFLAFSCISWACVHFYCYTFYFWHEVFFTIYLLVSAWIFMEEQPLPVKSIREKLITLMIFMACLMGYIRVSYYWFPNERVNGKEFVQDNWGVLSRANIIINNGFEEWAILPYLSQAGIGTVSMYTGLDEMSSKHIRLNYSRQRWIPSYDKVVSLLKKDRLNVLVITKDFLKQNYDNYLQYEPYQWKLREIACSEDTVELCIYEIKPDPKDLRNK